jgi:hypothetical protein
MLVSCWHLLISSLELRQVQIQNLLKIASVSDYIRCDMAYLSLNDVIEQVCDPKFIS